MNGMFRIFLLSALVFGSGSSAFAVESVPAPAAGGVTLRQCYEWAMGRNEDLKIRQEDIRQSEAKGKAALGGAFPRVTWNFDDTWQDPKGVDELNRQGFGGFVAKEQIESKFSAEQPLFSGLREFSAWSGFRRESESNRLRYERAARELFEETAQAFYAVVGHETDRANTSATFAIDQDRVKELRGFLRLGKSRESELFTAVAHESARKAALQQIESRIQSAREELSLLTGQDLSTAVLSDEIPAAPPLESLEATLAQAQGRTDLRAQREMVEAKRLRIRYERGFYWPTADVTGNYYTKRATFLQAIDWDVVFSLEVPLFQGGAVRARVQEAKSAFVQSTLMLQQMERDVVSSVRRTHKELAAAIQETQALEEAADAAQKSYDALRKEYKLGLVTNLDVIQALDLLQSQKSERDAARIRAKQLFIRLNVATEKLP
jgi:outer membrane protein